MITRRLRRSSANRSITRRSVIAKMCSTYKRTSFWCTATAPACVKYKSYSFHSRDKLPLSRETSSLLYPYKRILFADDRNSHSPTPRVSPRCELSFSQKKKKTFKTEITVTTDVHTYALRRLVYHVAYRASEMHAREPRVRMQRKISWLSATHRATYCIYIYYIYWVTLQVCISSSISL